MSPIPRKTFTFTFTLLTLHILLCFTPVYPQSTSDILTKSDVVSLEKTLISAAGKFQLGFFDYGLSSRYYLGIMYKDIPSDVIVWVANRDSPAYNDSVFLQLGNQANIIINDGDSKAIWQTNNSYGVNPVLQLLDSGNLVIREAADSNPNNFIWQSFDHPTDTQLPGQKLGIDFKTGLDRRLVSWAAKDDPGSGNYSLSVDRRGGHELYLRNLNEIIFRSGPYDGERFSGVPEMHTGRASYNFSFYSGPDEAYYMVVPSDGAPTRTVVTAEGVIENWIWVADTKQWNKFWYARQDQCDSYGVCGAYGICTPNDLFDCECPRGFKPKNLNSWNLKDWSEGCVRNKELGCESDGFVAVEDIKLPVTLNAFVDKTMSLAECRDACNRNCSCVGYGNSEFRRVGGLGCLIWTDTLIDMRYSPGRGQTLYLRLPASDIPVVGPDTSKGSTRNNKAKAVIGIGIPVGVTIILCGFITLMIWNRISSRKIQLGRGGLRDTSICRRSSGIVGSCREYSEDVVNADDDVELPIFDLHSIVVATDSFSEANTLGQGGFGRVYKGVMADGQEVAVKRLSNESGQGSEEFKNEVRLIAKLQHRNLVRLLGCCVDVDEKIIIYEYLKNTSLDSFLFDETRNLLLNWQTRFNIICGVARGLVYLHQDSRYRVIHRDLKASNILLDSDMNPKISDFGMARIFGGDESQGNTARVVGTYGYMAPEFAMDGLFSIKSDVFSFGVLVLEILSGTKNRGIFSSDSDLNLLGYAWEKWSQGKGKEMVDISMGETYSMDEVLRCLHVGLLCVQEKPEDRPTMVSVVAMLSSDTNSILPLPKFPGFRMRWNHNETDSSSTNRRDQSVTVNQLTITVINPR